MTDLRRSPRVQMAMECTLRRGSGSPIAARTVDVGPGGMCVRCSRPLAADEVLGFELAPPPPISGQARVLRQQGHDTYAVRFEVLAEPALAELTALATVR